MAQKQQKRQTYYGPPAPQPPSNPYFNMFNQAGSPVTLSPDYNNPLASAYPQPQRPSVPFSAAPDTVEAPEDMFMHPTMEPQEFPPFEEPRPDPSTAAPFNAAWRRNVQDSAQDFGSKMGGMFKDAGGWFKDKWNRAAEISQDPNRNLTEELFSRGRDAIVRGAKKIADEATDMDNMRPWAQKAYMSSQLGSPEELKLRTSPGQMGYDAGPSMPPLEEQGFAPGSEPALRRLQAMGMGSDVTPIEALGAKMWQGGRAVGRGAGEVGRVVGDMAGDALGGVAEGVGKFGGGLFGRMKEGFQKGQAAWDTSPKTAPQVSQGIGPTPSGEPMGGKGGFKGAFAAARKAGKKEFTYKGKKYNTKLKSQAKKTTVAKAKPKKKTASSVGGAYSGPGGRWGY